MTNSTVKTTRKQRLFIWLFAALMTIGLAGGPLVNSAEAGLDSVISTITSG